MRSFGTVCFAVLSVLAAGCPPSDNQTPPPPPKLDNVRLVGRQVCGPFTAGPSTFAFTCSGLPTTEKTGWELTPAWMPSTSNPQRQHANRVAVLTVSGPTFTEIDLEIEREGGLANLPLTQVDPNLPGRPGEVGGTRQVGVAPPTTGPRRRGRST